MLSISSFLIQSEKKGEKKTYHTSVVLEVKVDTVRSPPGLALADNNGGHNLLPELRLSLLDGGHDHVTHTSTGQTVQTGSDTLDRDDVQVTGTGVVAAVEDGSTDFLLVSLVWVGRISIRGSNVRGKTHGHLQLVASGTTTTISISFFFFFFSRYRGVGNSSVCLLPVC